MEPQLSTASSGTTGSSVSSQFGTDTPTRRLRVESSASSTSPWLLTEKVSSPQLSVQPVSHISGSGQGSPNLNSPTILPGYRESMFSGNQQQALPWRDGPRDESGRPMQQQLPPIASVGDRRPSHTSMLSTSSFINQQTRRTTQSGSIHPPPLLTTESTDRSIASSNSSMFYTPRTPLEPALDRVPQIPSLYHQNSSGMLDNQLPPLRPPSLSPQATVHKQYSPQGMLPDTQSLLHVRCL